MTKLSLLVSLAVCIPFTLSAQNDRKWSLQAGIGGFTMLENRYEGNDHIASEDQGNAFYVSADYWRSSRFALSGGLTFEQQGLLTHYADGIGLKKVNMLGVNAGVKYYFFPRKWVVQPHVGAALYTNVLNLTHRKGESRVNIKQGQPGTHGIMNYDVQCPALSLSPRIGVDIHLLSTLSLCIDYDYRFGLWGSSKTLLTFTDGPLMGQTVGSDELFNRSCISVGLKMDFPATAVSKTARNNLFMLLYSWLSSKAM